MSEQMTDDERLTRLELKVDILTQLLTRDFTPTDVLEATELAERWHNYGVKMRGEK
jgi:hypothetical protein